MSESTFTLHGEYTVQRDSTGEHWIHRMTDGAHSLDPYASPDDALIAVQRDAVAWVRPVAWAIEMPADYPRADEFREALARHALAAAPTSTAH